MVFFFLPSVHSQKYGQDSLKCVENLSLYKINFRMWKDYNFSADVINQVPVYDPWKWVFENCPLSSQNIYLDGVTILKYYYDKATDSIHKAQLLDSIMLVYDRRIQYFGNQKSSREGLVLGRKGIDLYTMSPDRFREIYEILGRSIELEQNESSSPVVLCYFINTIACARARVIDSSVIIENYDRLISIAEYNEELNKENQEALEEWKNVKANIESSFEPFATCEDLVMIFSKKFEKDPQNVDLLKKITQMLNKRNCTDSELFFEATKNLHHLEPTGESAYLMGLMYLKKEDYHKAKEYLIHSTELIQDTNKLADAYLLLANISFSHGELSQSRSYALKGIELRPNDGKFYLLIGDLYANSAKNCGDNDLTTRVAYWAAVDKYYKAKNVDPSVEADANERIGIYSRQFPSVETIFFYDMKEGDSYSVGCWINETTTVRASK
jgi:tetratricopeptide (TPR) repeat protein